MVNGQNGWLSILQGDLNTQTWLFCCSSYLGVIWNWNATLVKQLGFVVLCLNVSKTFWGFTTKIFLDTNIVPAHIFQQWKTFNYSNIIFQISKEITYLPSYDIISIKSIFLQNITIPAHRDLASPRCSLYNRSCKFSSPRFQMVNSKIMLTV